jgi:hypothetical protein
MLARAIGHLGSENDTAGFELPIPCGGLNPRIATPWGPNSTRISILQKAAG